MAYRKGTRNASIEPLCRGDNLVYLDSPTEAVFGLIGPYPDNEFVVHTTWKLVDSYANTWQLLSADHHWNRHEVTSVKLQEREIEKILQLYIDPKLYPGGIKATLECEVMFFPASADGSKYDDEQYGFTLTKDLYLITSLDRFESTKKQRRIFTGQFEICHDLLDTRRFHVFQGYDLSVHINSHWSVPGCGADTFKISLCRHQLGKDEQDVVDLAVDWNTGATHEWNNLEQREYYLSIQPLNRDSNCCLLGTVTVETKPG